MGLIKRQLLKVIQWENASPDIIVQKFEEGDRYAIMKGSELIVRPSQAAIFVYRGSVADVFTEGNWKLEEGSTPILTGLANWKYAFENPKDVDVYFVSLRRFTQMKWGTPNPIMMRDKDFGMIRVMGHGEYSFHVCNPEVFMRECFGTIRSFKTQDIQDHLKSVVIAELSDMLGECQIPALDLAANYLELGDTTRDHASARFKSLGLDIDQILIRNFKLPEVVEKAMDQRTTLGVFDGKMSEYAQYESVQAMRDAAKNPGAGGMFASAGIGLGMGTRMGGKFADSIDSIQSGDQKKVTCAKCGASMRADAKFCPECGAKNVSGDKQECPKCGAVISVNAKFCPECGAPIVTKCPKCGVAVKSGAKFCPECGAKIK